jgi:ribosome-binding protein aMBF1 (putative translation factor)
MSGKRIHRKLDRTPEEIARLKATRARLQSEKPTVEQLLAEGGHEDVVALGDLLVVHQIAHRLKEARGRLELSLADLSLKTGIDPAVLARLENGEQPNPTMETLARVATALGKRLVCDLQEA